MPEENPLEHLYTDVIAKTAETLTDQTDSSPSDKLLARTLIREEAGKIAHRMVKTGKLGNDEGEQTIRAVRERGIPIQEDATVTKSREDQIEQIADKATNPARFRQAIRSATILGRPTREGD